MSEKSLLDQWRDMAYSKEMDRGALQKFWGTYFTIEKGIYEQLLNEPEVEVKGTVQELADKYGLELLTMVGFLDGINDSLKEANPIETMEADTEVNLIFDKEKLYNCHSGMRSLMLRQRNVFTENRRIPERSVRRRRSEETIRVRVEVARNTRSAVEDNPC